MTIPLEMLEQMFEGMRSNGWNVDGDLLWGYFFTDPDPTALQNAAPLLESAGYAFVSIYRGEVEEGQEDPGIYWLHVERVETHSAASLHLRNQELATFAKRTGVACYDGMDVGPPEKDPRWSAKQEKKGK